MKPHPILCHACISPVIHFGVQYICLPCHRIGATLPSWADTAEAPQTDGVNRAKDFKLALRELSRS